MEKLNAELKTVFPHLGPGAGGKAKKANKIGIILKNGGPGSLQH